MGSGGFRKVSDRVGVNGVGAKFPFFAVFWSFPRGRRLRDNRQHLPGNVQKTLDSPEPKKSARKVKQQQKKQTGRQAEPKKRGKNANTIEKRKK